MIVEEGGAIKLGQYTWLKEDRINYLVHGTGRRGVPGQYYSLASTLLLLRTGWLTDTAYEIRAGLEGVPCVERQDRISLLVFLMGRKWKKGDYIVVCICKWFYIVFVCRCKYDWEFQYV